MLSLKYEIAKSFKSQSHTQAGRIGDYLMLGIFVIYSLGHALVYFYTR